MPLFHDPSFSPFLRTLFPWAFNAPGKRGGGGFFRGHFPWDIPSPPLLLPRSHRCQSHHRGLELRPGHSRAGRAVARPRLGLSEVQLVV